MGKFTKIFAVDKFFQPTARNKRRFVGASRVMLTLALALFIGVLTSRDALAQSATSGAVSGTVTDPSGAVVPLATVELTSTDTNALQTMPTNASGQYTFTGVRPGAAKTTVQIAAFRFLSVR